LVSLFALFSSKKRLFWWSAVAVLAADQLTKWLFWFPPGTGRKPMVLVPHLLQFVSHEGNVRGALGLGPAGRSFYIAAAVMGLLLVAVFFLTTAPRKSLVLFALGMLAGGAVGNLIDRVVLARVRDFIDLHWGDAFHWHTFNLADAAICVGIALMVWDSLFSKDQGVEGLGPRRRRSPPR
jgi:signal peptidase II